MTLKKFIPNAAEPNLVAIYDIDNADNRVNHFNGVILDTDDGRVTHLLVRTKKTAENAYIDDRLPGALIEKELLNKFPAYFTDGVILYQQPLPGKEPKSPFLCTGQEYLMPSTLRDKLNEMTDKASTKIIADQIPSGEVDIINKQNQGKRSYHGF